MEQLGEKLMKSQSKHKENIKPNIAIVDKRKKKTDIEKIPTCQHKIYKKPLTNHQSSLSGKRLSLIGRLSNINSLENTRILWGAHFQKLLDPKNILSSIWDCQFYYPEVELIKRLF